MLPPFLIKKIPPEQSGNVHAYWVESTAPDNVDDDPNAVKSSPTKSPLLVQLDALPDCDIKSLAEHLNENGNREIVISVHGFNSPREVAAERHEKAYQYLSGDPAIKKHLNDLVLVGYRWPSERMFSAARGGIGAMPWGLVGATILAAILVFVGSALSLWHSSAVWRILGWIISRVGWIAASVPFVLFLLRAVVYFRDNYRALNYGALDLVDFLRKLHKAIEEDRGAREQRSKSVSDSRVALTFIGHSMGAFVVTNAVRVLSDAFVDAAINATSPENSTDADQATDESWSHIGRVFSLGRLVLVSPDIPAEALMLGRANFLASSLRRFKEAYLFSNNGDVVLKIVSTLANYFSFPTRNRKYGQRLGNISVVSDHYGISVPLNDSAEAFLSGIAVGGFTLANLNATILKGARSRSLEAVNTRGETTADRKHVEVLPCKFSYFDCTDYVENGVPMLAFGGRPSRLGWFDNVRLLCEYLCRRVDVHSGYFDGERSQKLIFRLACLGYINLLSSLSDGAQNGVAALDTECKQAQIRVLLSPWLP